MTTKKFMSSCLLAAAAILALPASANNINATSARTVANDFLKQHAATHRTFKSSSLADLKLVHAEASRTVANANAYYAFNIEGGGFVIVAGEDRANQVLGYSDHGRLDFNNLPDNFKALMRSYREEIEYLQAHPELDITPSINAATGNGVEPLIKAIWGQEMPYYLQCPVYQNQYCAVGCIATAMSQVMYYWKYPTSSPALNSYYCYDIGQTVPSLPATTFEYNKMLTSYCHWDWDLNDLVQDAYTDEQAQAVAKLARYCGQAVNMGYHPDGSGAYTSSQLAGMKKFGYSNNAKDVTRDGWWENYSTAQWEAMIKAELDAHRPILYSANDYSAGGHAFVCDGYDNTGMFHFNFGWYGTCDGWYKSTALNMVHRTGEELKFNSDHEMLTGIEPPVYCVIFTDGLNASDDLYVLGETAPVKAMNLSIYSTYSTVNLIYGFLDADGKDTGKSQSANISTAEYAEGGDLTTMVTLPAGLGQGSYHVKFYYQPSGSRVRTQIDCDELSLNVVGNLAKFNAPFTIDDVTMSLDYIIKGNHPNLTIDDVTTLIDVLIAAAE